MWAAAKFFCWPPLIGVPIGFLAGVYLAEYGGKTFAFVVRYAVDLLNGVPSIVIGIFAYALIVLPHETFFGAGRRRGAWHHDDSDRGPNHRRISARRARIPCAKAPWRWAPPKPKRFSPWWFRPRCPGLISGMMLNLARVAGETAPLLVHRARQSVLEHGLDAADRNASGDDLQLRHLSL